MSVACRKPGSKCFSLTPIRNRFLYCLLSLQLSCCNYDAFSCISTTGISDKPPSLAHTCHAMRSYVRSKHHDVLKCIGQTGGPCHIKCKNFLKSRFPLQGMSTSNNYPSYKPISGMRFEPGIFRTLSCQKDVMITNQMILREWSTNKTNTGPKPLNHRLSVMKTRTTNDITNRATITVQSQQINIKNKVMPHLFPGNKARRGKPDVSR
jgi:hypothetical protein